jgi:uncharacterized membrane protein
MVVQNLLAAAVLLAAAAASLEKDPVEQADRSVMVGRKKWLAAGCGAGVVFALALAVLKHTTVLINREYWNFGILSATLISGVAFLAFLWGFLKRQSPKAQETGLRAAGAVFCCSLLFYALPDIFLAPTEFVMAGESVFSTDFLYKLIGYLAGLALACGWGAVLSKTAAGLTRAALFTIVTAGAAIHMTDSALRVAQSLYARRVIPSSKFLFDILKNAVNYRDFFLYAIMAVTFLVPLLCWFVSTGQPTGFRNPAERRKSKAAARKARRRCVAVVCCHAFALFTLTAVKAYNEREVVLSPIEPAETVEDEIRIPADVVGDGHLHRFAYTASDGTEVRFIAIKKNESAYGVGLDACDICGPTGYYERKDEVICKLCDVVMNKSTIGFKGGCNPVPLAYTLENGRMVIQIAHLENEKGRFK